MKFELEQTNRRASGEALLEDLSRCAAESGADTIQQTAILNPSAAGATWGRAMPFMLDLRVEMWALGERRSLGAIG
jgi:hypothetical protein